jgi:hypothetical protein
MDFGVVWPLVLILFIVAFHREIAKHQDHANEVILTTALHDKTNFMRLIKEMPEWVSLWWTKLVLTVT